jgi:hypothetical protein
MRGPSVFLHSHYQQNAPVDGRYKKAIGGSCVEQSPSVLVHWLGRVINPWATVMYEHSRLKAQSPVRVFGGKGGIPCNRHSRDVAEADALYITPTISA